MLRPDDRAKLVKILGLLGSDKAGEVAAAGKAAQRILQGAGAQWEDLIVLPGLSAPVRQLSSREFCATAAGGFRETVAWLDRRFDLLTEWEVYFVGSVRRRRTLTGKQAEKLRQIIADVTQREAGL